MVLRARELRRRPSLPERLLWRVLRTRPEGLKFRQQHPIGWYIVDFYCPATKLVVEVDGESHGMGGRPIHDDNRDEWLKGQGLRVIRFCGDRGDEGFGVGGYGDTRRLSALVTPPPASLVPLPIAVR